MELYDLEEKIKYYAQKYYEGNPEIDDVVFDNLVDKLRELKPDSYILTTGWGFEVLGNKLKHKYSHIGSLDKAKAYDEIPERFKNEVVYISPKLDGLSAVAYYENGKLVKGITRGNGEYGKDITNKLLLILGTEISDNAFTGAVRGELIISESNWKKIQSNHSDLIAPRNYAAGIINRKEIDDDIKYIDLVVYKVVGQENKSFLSNRAQVLNWLTANFKHIIPICFYPVLSETTWNTYHEETFKTFKQLGYGLDGLVLTSSAVLYNEHTKGYIYDEVAFKFSSDIDETIVKGMEWTLSRTQRLVPVCLLEPVELAGAIIQRATCNNARQVYDWNIGVGAKVQITRSNEVIPMILNVIEESEEELPTNCPICNSELVWEGVDLKCANPKCPNIDASDLQQWCECIGETDGLQWTLMKQYLDGYGITNIESLYVKAQYIWTDLNSRELSLTELKIREFFKNLYINPININTALLALNIPRLGDKTSKLFYNEKGFIQSLLNFACNKKIDINYPEWIPYHNKLIELVKGATTLSIEQNLDKFSNLKYLIYSNFRIQFPEAVKEQKFIAVTGALNTMKRDAFEKYINQYGYILTSNLKKCEYLVTNNRSNSSKCKDADKYGISIINEVEFLSLLK